MGIMPMFDKGAILNPVAAFQKQLELAFVTLLKYMGEKLAKYAKDSHNYQDQTGNLTNSIGYAVVQKRGSGCCGEQCNDQHSDKCDRIAAQCEIQSEKRIGKEEIDTDYGENRRKEHVQVSVRISCNQDLDNNIK